MTPVLGTSAFVRTRDHDLAVAHLPSAMICRHRVDVTHSTHGSAICATVMISLELEEQWGKPLA